jgi:hypothetical protein
MTGKKKKTNDPFSPTQLRAGYGVTGTAGHYRVHPSDPIGGVIDR